MDALWRVCLQSLSFYRNWATVFDMRFNRRQICFAEWKKIPAKVVIIGVVVNESVKINFQEARFAVETKEPIILNRIRYKSAVAILLCIKYFPFSWLLFCQI